MRYVKAVYDDRADVYLAFLENDDLGWATHCLESAFGPARSVTVVEAWENPYLVSQLGEG